MPHQWINGNHARLPPQQFSTPHLNMQPMLTFESLIQSQLMPPCPPPIEPYVPEPNPFNVPRSPCTIDPTEGMPSYSYDQHSRPEFTLYSLGRPVCRQEDPLTDQLAPLNAPLIAGSMVEFAMNGLAISPLNFPSDSTPLQPHGDSTVTNPIFSDFQMFTNLSEYRDEPHAYSLLPSPCDCNNESANVFDHNGGAEPTANGQPTLPMLDLQARFESSLSSALSEASVESHQSPSPPPTPLDAAAISVQVSGPRMRMSATTTRLSRRRRKKTPKMHQCPTCGKKFPRPSGLSTHENTHTGVKRTSSIQSTDTHHAQPISLFPCPSIPLLVSQMCDVIYSTLKRNAASPDTRIRA